MVNESRFGAMPSAEWSALQAAVERFEDAWQRGAPPRVEDFLPAEPGPRLLLLAELLHVDLEWRLNRGHAARVEDYLRRFPELEDEPRAVLDLVEAEFRLRRRREPGLAADEYLRRFPRCGPELAARLAATGDGQPATLKSAPGPARGPETAETLNGGPAGLAGEPVLPEQFGRYRVVKLLGRGGMGSVYLAHDTELDRPVALKVPRLPAEAGREVVERFQREARAAATLQHPNICPVYDVGRADGVHYLTMAYVEGRPLSAYVKAGKPLMSQAQAAAVVRKLALALHEAHSRGVVHRDLKPSNVMVNRRGEPVVMDFGLALRAAPGDARLTQSGCTLGTPAYMPPEQVDGELAAMGPASDVYSLGAVLYELLTGRPPFRGTPARVCSLVLTTEPEPPTRQRPDLHPGLEAVCLKALAKKPSDRYASMKDFAAALGECLRALSPPPATTTVPERQAPASQPAPVPPTPAPPPRRRPRWFWVAAAVAAVALLGAGAWLLSGVVFRLQTPEGTLVVDVDQPGAEVSVDGNQVTITRPNDPEPVRVTRQAGKHELKVSKGGFETVTKEFTLDAGKPTQIKVTLQPKAADGAPPGGPLVLHELHRFEGPPDRPTAWVRAVGFAPDGRSAVAADHEGGVRLLDLTSNKQAERFLWPGGGVHVADVAYSPDGRFLLFGGNSPDAFLWDVATRKQVRTFRVDNVRAENVGPINALAFSPDGGRALTACWDVQLWDVATGKLIRTVKGKPGGPANGVTCVAFSPDGRRFAYGSLGTVALCDVESGDEVRLFEPGGWVDSVAFSPDGRKLLGSAEHKPDLHLWDVETGKQLWAGKSAEKGKVRSALFCPDGRHVLSANETDGVIRLWDTQADREVARLEGHSEGVLRLALSPDGRFCLSGGMDGTARLWRLPDFVAARPADADRRAAEWVLKVGGAVQVEVAGAFSQVDKLQALPASPFRLRLVDSRGSKDVTDASLENLRGLTGLKDVRLGDSPVGDGALERLKDQKGLVSLWLWGTAVTDAGLRLLPEWPELEGLDLSGTAVTDDGLRRLRSVKKLWALGLNQCRVTDESLEILAGLTELQLLALNGNAGITGSGLKHLGGAAALAKLYLNDTRVDDASLTHLTGLNLHELALQRTRVTDGAVEHLKKMKGLHELWVEGTAFSEKGAAELKAALPDCKVHRGAADAADRRAAEWVLQQGGAVRVDPVTGAAPGAPGSTPVTAPPAELPAGDLVLRAVSHGKGAITDDGLQRLSSLSGLEEIDLWSGRVTDAGLKHLRNLVSLRRLALFQNQVRGPGLEHLRGLADLEYLDLGGNPCAGEGLEHLKALPKLHTLLLHNTLLTGQALEPLEGLDQLRTLSLSYTKVSEEGLAHLRGLTGLRTLHLDGVGVTDAGLERLRGLTGLRELRLKGNRLTDRGLEQLGRFKDLLALDIEGCQATEAGVGRLREALPGCQVFAQGTFRPDALARYEKGPWAAFRPAEEELRGRPGARAVEAGVELTDVGLWAVPRFRGDDVVIRAKANLSKGQKASLFLRHTREDGRPDTDYAAYFTRERFGIGFADDQGRWQDLVICMVSEGGDALSEIAFAAEGDRLLAYFNGHCLEVKDGHYGGGAVGLGTGPGECVLFKDVEVQVLKGPKPGEK